MDKKELVEVLKEHFFTKSEIDQRFASKDDHTALVHRVKGIEESLEELHEKFDESKASSDVLDKILEKHPVERIERIEKHLDLPVFVAVGAEED